MPTTNNTPIIKINSYRFTPALDLELMVRGLEGGVFGRNSYDEGKMKGWAEIVDDGLKSDEPESNSYYLPQAEIELTQDPRVIERIKRVAGATTIISRAPGTTFDIKDGALALHLDEVTKAVGIGATNSELHDFWEKVDSLFPNAEKVLFRADHNDPTLPVRDEIIAGTTEVDFCMGGTRDNVEGMAKDGSPKEAYLNNIRSWRQQMAQGAHLFTTTDTNSDAESLLAAYNKIKNLALATLQKAGVNTEHIDFHVQFHEEIWLVAQYYVLTKDQSISTAIDTHDLLKGFSMQLMNSLKMPIEKKLEWEREGGLECLDDVADVPFDSSNRVAFVHLRNPANTLAP